MKEFLEKYRTDKKYKAKVQLSLYTIFVLIVSIYAISGSRNVVSSNEKPTLKENYSYQVNINLNDNLYKYYGTKSNEVITINKISNEETVNYYSYKDNNYYKYENNTYVLTTEEEVYDIIEFNYLSLETINKYLSISTLTEDKNIVYLKDIIIGNNSEEYITIEKEENKYNVDYTELMKLFNNEIEKLTVEIIIE